MGLQEVAVIIALGVLAFTFWRLARSLRGTKDIDHAPEEPDVSTMGPEANLPLDGPQEGTGALLDAVERGWLAGPEFSRTAAPASETDPYPATAISHPVPAIPPQHEVSEEETPHRRAPRPRDRKGRSSRRSAPGPTPLPRARTVFLCYRRTDSTHVSGRIYDRLAQHFGKTAIVKDVDSIPLGVDFRRHIDSLVADCSVFVVIIGEKWLSVTTTSGDRRIDDPRDHVRLEVESALAREIPVIPVYVDGALVLAEDALPPSLRALPYRNAMNVRPDPDFHRDVDRLVAGIHPHLEPVQDTGLE